MGRKMGREGRGGLQEDATVRRVGGEFSGGGAARSCHQEGGADAYPCEGPNNR